MLKKNRLIALITILLIFLLVIYYYTIKTMNNAVPDSFIDSTVSINNKKPIKQRQALIKTNEECDNIRQIDNKLLSDNLSLNPS